MNDARGKAEALVAEKMQAMTGGLQPAARHEAAVLAGAPGTAPFVTKN